MSKAISSRELREKYQIFFEGKKHTRIPSAPLVPENDPSVLFTTAGMHPLVPYLKGVEHPMGKRLTDVQICLRTTDIEEVGDSSHSTVFEMLGNWSLGDYFKEDAIAYSWEFLTSPKWLGLDQDRLAVSVFAGNESCPRDEESAQIWKAMGVPVERIVYLDAQENWWPAGAEAPGPQGPDTEIFYWVGDDAVPRAFDANDDRWVEIWNNVFIQYDRSEDDILSELKQRNVDTGMGLERTVMVLNGLSSIYDIDTYTKLMRVILNLRNTDDLKQSRILADHIKAVTFMLGDVHSIVPSNTEQGYVLRRVIRRAVWAAKKLGIEDTERILTEGTGLIIDEFASNYPNLVKCRSLIIDELKKEVAKFSLALEKGRKYLETNIRRLDTKIISAETAFNSLASYGLPIEMTVEIGREMGYETDVKGVEFLMKAHQDISRQGADKKFEGGLADHSDESVAYHTATHLLHQALKDVLGEHVRQRGSNITPQRLRFDFAHPEKMTEEQLKKVSDIVNQKIADNLTITRKVTNVTEAKQSSALGLFEDKYGDEVSVYSIGEYSREICGGPHVDSTGNMGRFVIQKEESAGAGIRRIKAGLEK